MRPIYASLTLGFISQGIQFPVLPQLARSLGLGTADLGLVTACTSCARLLANVPATWMAEKVGRRPMLMSGPSMAAVGMLGLANASSFEHLVVSNICVGTGLATTMAGASLPLRRVDAAQPRAEHRAAATVGAARLRHRPRHRRRPRAVQAAPFVACAGGLFASSMPPRHRCLRREEVRSRRSRQRELLRSARQAAEDGDDAGREGWSEAAAARGAVEKDGGGTGRGGGGSAGGGMAAWLPRLDDESLRLLRRPALQGLGASIFMNGFSQGAFPVTLVLFAVEHMNMCSATVGGMLTANVTLMVLVLPATKLSTG